MLTGHFPSLAVPVSLADQELFISYTVIFQAWYAIVPWIKTGVNAGFITWGQVSLWQDILETLILHAV